MDLEEIANRINNRRILEELEQKPALPYDPADSMETLDEAKDFIRFLYAQVQEKNSREEMLMQEIASMKEVVSQKEKETDTVSRLLANIERLMHELSEARAEISRLVSVNSSLAEQISVLKKHRYGSPSQRNRRSKEADNM